jgi:phage terminase large subunit-like protein
VPVIERTPTVDKIARLSGTEALIEGGGLYLPNDEPWLHDYEKELFGFPATKYDDQVDSTSQYFAWTNERRAQRFDFDFGGGEAIPSVEDVLGAMRR